jgi:2',3'-cyclic-nucleotide 2'-phosphodiesterase (5'-nucleotidase family)
MLEPFKMCHVDVAMIGNHDLDFGVLQLANCIRQTKSHTKHFGDLQHDEGC